MKKTIFRAALFTLVATWAGLGLAATCQSDSSGNWSSSSRWDCGQVPTSSDDVVISAGDAVTINVNAISIKSLTVNGTLNGNSANFRIAISGNLTVSNGAVFNAQLANANGGNNTIGGNLVNNGTFNTNTSNSGYWEFNGTAVQTINGDVAFPNVKISNSVAATGVTVINGTTFTIKDYGKLDLTSARISTDSSSKVSITATQCNQNHNNIQGGWVNGNLQYHFPGDNGACTFKIGDASSYAPVTLNVNFFNGINANGAGGMLTASTKGVAHPNLATSGLSTTKYVKRYWTIGAADDDFSCVNGSGNVGYTATFNFVPGDIQGGGNTGAFSVGRYSNGWATPAQNGRTSTSTTVVVSPAAGSAAWGSYAIGEVVGAPSGSGIDSGCSNGAPVAEWRLDEALWNGTPGEVKDSVGTYHGVAARAAGSTSLPTTAVGTPAYTSSSTGLTTCRYGEFDRSSPARTYSYVQLGSFPSTPPQFTFAGWIRTTDRTVSGQRILVNDDDQNGWAFSLGDSSAGKLRLFNRNLRTNGSVTGSGSNSDCGAGASDPFCLDTGAVIADNTWYFVAATINNAAKKATLYVFNQSGGSVAKVSSAYTNSWVNGTGAVAIGGETAASSEGTQSAFHFKGNIDEVKVYGAALSENALKSELTRARSCVAAVNHIRIEHDGEGLTCSPELVTVKACADANCTSLYSGSVTLTLSPGGAGLTFTGSTSAAPVSRTTVGSAVLSTPSVSPGVTSATRCFKTTASGTVEDCNMNFVDSGFLISVPAHKSETAQTISISAVKKSDNSLACTPAFAGVTKAVNLKCSYVNPTASVSNGTGQLPIRINDTALNAATNTGNACDTTGANINLSFNATGVATPTLKYADVGQLNLSASYTGAGVDANLSMSGSQTFVVAPDHFAFSEVTSGNIKAGGNFSATVTAQNAANNATPGFGKETSPESITLGLGARIAPSGSNNCTDGPCDGTVTGDVGTWNSGKATSSNVQYSEVGQATVKATLKSGTYLGSGLTASGTSATVGPFVPAYFDTTVVQGCNDVFTYSGQPFRVTATARNMQGNTTVNYSFFKDGSGNSTCSVCSQLVTLSDSNAASPMDGTFSNNTIAASAFTKGVGQSPAVTAESAPLPVSYTFTTKLTAAREAPTTLPLKLRAKDVHTDVPSSVTPVEGTTKVRSGRLVLSNAFGTERQPLGMPVRADYWSVANGTWVLNSLDSCTALTDANFYKSSALTNLGGVNLANGQGTLMLSAPGAGNVGSVDIAANLGDSGNDLSCLNSHGGTPGKLSWLRSRNGSCAASYDRDPSARASFGVYSPESRRVIHTREFF